MIWAALLARAKVALAKPQDICRTTPVKSSLGPNGLDTALVRRLCAKGSSLWYEVACQCCRPPEAPYRRRRAPMAAPHM
ncbi:uncharacterized protein C8Q71DRAFT_741532, partial [Rhodofomes roseus]